MASLSLSESLVKDLSLATASLRDISQSASLNLQATAGAIQNIGTAVGNTLIPQVAKSLGDVTTAVSTQVIPQVGTIITQVGDGVRVSILPQVGRVIESAGDVVQSASNFLPRINTTLEGIGATVQGTVAHIGQDIRDTTIPRINAALDTVHRTAKDTRTMVIATTVLLVILCLTCITVIIYLIYLMYTGSKKDEYRKEVISKPLVLNPEPIIV